MSNTKPERSNAGKKPENNPASAATSCPRRVTEISSPCPSALSMNMDDNNTSTHREPRKGTAKSVTAATEHRAMLNMPMQKYGISLPSSSCMRLTGVANMASMVPRSHSRANTREVSSVPIRVMMTVMAPGTRNCTLLAAGLYQKRG